MRRYRSFEEYFQEASYNDFIELFEAFLPLEYKRINDVNDEIICDVYDVYIKGIEFTKSQLNRVEFDCYFMVKYQLYLDGQEIFNGSETNGYIAHYSGNFRDGFKLAKKKIVKVDQQPFIEKLTQNLVPIISKDKMDQYASKFLKEYCPEALKTPMPLLLDKILNKAGLSCYFAPLEYGVFGKIYFSDDEADYYNGQLIHGQVSRGTILVSDQKAYERGKKAFRNTIIHEAVHWFFHSNFFELRQLLDSKKTCQSCFKKETKGENSEIEWMESQARSITPKILMPKNMFLKQYKTELKQERQIAKCLKKEFGRPRSASDINYSIIVTFGTSSCLMLS